MIEERSAPACGTVAQLAFSEPLFALGVGAALATGGVSVVDEPLDVAALAGSAVEVVIGDPVLLTPDRVARIAGARVGVLVLAHDLVGAQVRSTVKAGARGYLLAGTLAAELTASTRAVASGRFALADEAQEAMLEHDASEHPALSEREREVLALVADGCTNSQIAARLFVGEATVKTHLHRAGEKLGERRRGAIVRCAIQRGYV